MSSSRAAGPDTTWLTHTDTASAIVVPVATPDATRNLTVASRSSVDVSAAGFSSYAGSRSATMMSFGASKFAMMAYRCDGSTETYSTSGAAIVTSASQISSGNASPPLPVCA